MNIGVIGTGNMGQAILRGYVAVHPERASEIFVYNRHEEKAINLAGELKVNVCRDIDQVVEKADIILLAVKPAQFPEVMPKVKETMEKSAKGMQKTIVSIAAGVSIAYIESFFQNQSNAVKVVRIMPNTPAMVGSAMSSISVNQGVDEESKKSVEEIFASIGRVAFVDEGLIDAVIGVSGSAPAYVYLFIEALADGAVAEGMPRAAAYEFAAQTVLGSAKMVLETGLHPGVLKDQVCSPAGTTMEAVHVLEDAGFRGIVMDAVRAAAEKSKDMAKK